jgi:phenylacetate-CoA ligase
VNAWVARQLYFAAQALRREPVARVLVELERSQRWPRERLLELQRRRVAALLEHAFRHVPYYRSTWSASGFREGDWEDPQALSHLPPLEKRDLRERALDLRAARPGRAVPASTSGSAGTPVSVLRSQASWAHAHANVFRGWRWHGIQPGERYAYLWGLALDAAGRRRAALRDRFFNRERCSAFSLDGPRAVAFFEHLRRRPAAFAVGYPSALSLFAAELEARGLDGRALGWKAAVTTAEVLHEHQRELIARCFGCPVVDSYGCAEVGVVGFECERGGMHVPVESVCVEWLPPGQEAAQPEVLLTDLHNLAQPLVRYRVGDLVARAEGPCACGRGLPRLGAIQGRAGDTLHLPDGRAVNANLPSYVFKHHAKAGTVREYQFVQHADGRIELRLVAGPRFVEATAAEIRAEVAGALGVEAEIRVVERIERRGRGKHRDFVQTGEAS